MRNIHNCHSAGGALPKGIGFNEAHPETLGEHYQDPMIPEARIFGISRMRDGTDGPGMRTLVAFSGCPLSCPECINAEVMASGHGDRFTPESLLGELAIDDSLFKASSGGITFGGGEPLLHSRFIARFHEICPEGWTIAIETSLNVPEEDVARLCGIADYWYIDIKDMAPDTYRSYTGVSNAQVISNLKYMVGQGISGRMTIRIPEIEGHNDRGAVERSVAILEGMGLRTETLKYASPKSSCTGMSHGGRTYLMGALILEDAVGIDSAARAGREETLKKEIEELQNGYETDCVRDV